MGRSILPVTQLLFEQIKEVKPLYGALRRGDQLILDDMFELVRQHRAAIANAANLLPLEAMLMLMLMEERKRNNRIRHEIYGELRELRDQIEELKKDGL